MLSETEHLLSILAEEATEVAQATSKAVRFGLSDKKPDSDQPTNAVKILDELNDLVAVIEMLQDKQALPPNDPDYIRNSKIRKKAKIRQWMAYARTRGTLER